MKDERAKISKRKLNVNIILGNTSVSQTQLITLCYCRSSASKFCPFGHLGNTPRQHSVIQHQA